MVTSYWTNFYTSFKMYHDSDFLVYITGSKFYIYLDEIDTLILSEKQSSPFDFERTMLRHADAGLNLFSNQNHEGKVAIASTYEPVLPIAAHTITHLTIPSNLFLNHFTVSTFVTLCCVPILALHRRLLATLAPGLVL